MAAEGLNQALSCCVCRAAASAVVLYFTQLRSQQLTSYHVMWVARAMQLPAHGLSADDTLLRLLLLLCYPQVKAFAAAAVGPPVAGYPCPPYKLLILDEADSMTQVGGGGGLEGVGVEQVGMIACVCGWGVAGDMVCVETVCVLFQGDA